MPFDFAQAVLTADICSESQTNYLGAFVSKLKKNDRTKFLSFCDPQRS